MKLIDIINEVSKEVKAARKKATGIEKEKRDKAQATKLKKRVAGSEKTALEKEREKNQRERERRQDLIKKKTEQEREKREREREREQKKPDDEGMSGTTKDEPEKKKPIPAAKKKSKFGLGSALKDLGKYTMAKAQAAGDK